MRFQLPRIYPITDRKLSNLDHHQQAGQFIEGGATIIQLREKEMSSSQFFRAALKTLKIARAKNVKLIINDRVDVALMIEADGVHLGQKDLPPGEARKLLGEKAIIGFSTHNTKQACAALELPIDYIAIGPVFETKTKDRTEPALGLDGISRVRELVGDFPLVAIGGITPENAVGVFNAGADSVALISPLFTETGSPAARLRVLIALSEGFFAIPVSENKS